MTNIKYTVYKHTFPNNKVYIGITSQSVYKRWQSGFGYMQQPLIYNAIQKYGWENIKHEILFTGLTKEEAESKEVELIALYHSNNSAFGYNIANGGNHNGKHSEETKQKIKNMNVGKHSYLSGAWIGKHHSDITIKLFSEQRKGKTPWNKGIPMSNETKRKISKSEKGKIITNETRRKMSDSHSKEVVCIETNVIYKSAKEAAYLTHIEQSNVVRACNGKRKSAGGYHWRYNNVV